MRRRGVWVLSCKYKDNWTGYLIPSGGRFAEKSAEVALSVIEGKYRYGGYISIEEKTTA